MLQLHSQHLRQFGPMYMKLDQSSNSSVYGMMKLLPNNIFMLVVLVPYSQLSLQSVDFSISLSELLLNLGTPSIHLCLQQQTV